jgi:hypothetical protein
VVKWRLIGDTAMPLAEWETFYVIVGSSAAALTGLMFVVIALLADTRGTLKPTEHQINAFGTPTVVHFGAVLLQSAILAAPWPGLGGVRIALGLYGGTAVVYTLIVLKRARRQREYQPVLEDWLFHAVLPLAAYTAIVAAAGALPRSPALLFVPAGAAVLLMFIGLHNAWDTVTFIVVSEADKPDRNRDVDVEKQTGM